MSICQDNGCKGHDHNHARFHDSHTLAVTQTAGRPYVYCTKPDCNADDIQDAEKPCPAPLRSNAWAVQGGKSMTYNEGNQLADDDLSEFEVGTVATVGPPSMEGSQCPICGRRFANPPGSRLMCYYHNTTTVAIEAGGEQ